MRAESVSSASFSHCAAAHSLIHPTNTFPFPICWFETETAGHAGAAHMQTVVTETWDDWKSVWSFSNIKHKDQNSYLKLFQSSVLNTKQWRIKGFSICMPEYAPDNYYPDDFEKPSESDLATDNSASVNIECLLCHWGNYQWWHQSEWHFSESKQSRRQLAVWAPDWIINLSPACCIATLDAKRSKICRRQKSGV